MREINVLASLSGRGGGEQSIISIVNELTKNGWKVYLIPWGPVHESYKNNPSLQFFTFSDGMAEKMKEGIPLFFYGNDQVYRFNKQEESSKIVDKSSKIILGINFIIGGLSKSQWLADTKKVVGAIFLNEEKRSSWEDNYTKYYDYDINLSFLPPCIDVDKFKDIPIKSRENGDPFIVIRHSRGDDRKFVVEKNIGKGENVYPWQSHISQDLDIDFYENLLENVPNVHFKFMKGNNTLIDKFKDDKRFTFYEWDQISIYDFLSEGHVYLFRIAKSLRDQGPRCICEAMAAGLPVMAEPRDGPRNRIEHGYNGFYGIETIDYISKLQLMEKHDGMRVGMGLNAQITAITKFIPIQWVRKIEECLCVEEAQLPLAQKVIQKVNKKKINSKYKYINKLKITSSSITPREYIYLYELVAANNIKNILEFGPGFSTYAFLEHNCNIYSFENKDHWLDVSKNEFANFPNVHIYGYKYEEDIKIDNLDKINIDMSFIDAPQGTRDNSRLHTCIFSSKKTNCFILHDCKRKPEQTTMELFQKQGWNYTMVDSDRGLGICYKNDFIIPKYDTDKLNYLIKRHK